MFILLYHIIFMQENVKIQHASEWVKNILNINTISLMYQEQVNGILCAAHIYLPCFSFAYHLL